MSHINAFVFVEENRSPREAALLASRKCAKIFIQDSQFNADLPAGMHICEPCASWHDAANRVIEKASSDDFILFISSLSEFDASVIDILLDDFIDDVALAGVNPLFAIRDGKFAANLGVVADSQGYLRGLYEGLGIGDELCRKKRCFQIASPAFLLVRAADAKAIGAFDTRNRDVCFMGFCLDLLKRHPKGFATLPKARVRYENHLWQLESFGVINSLNLRGKIAPGTFVSDYAEKVRADGLEYGVSDWLQEGPLEKLPICEDSWFKWRNDSRPENLLAWLASLRPEETGRYLGLIRELPCYLPAQMRWQKVIAQKKLEYAEHQGLDIMAGQIRSWQKREKSFHYGKLRKGMTLLRKAGIYNWSLDRCPAIYDAWLELAPAAQPARIEIDSDWPKIAVAMPVYNPDLSFFAQAVESVRTQSYQNWELCMADDASPNPEVREMLMALASQDKRVKVTFRQENGHISRATNSALALVTAPWTAFMDDDDLLASDALAEVAKAAVGSGLSLLYSDFDHIDSNNVCRNPVFRPDFDFDYNFMGHLACYKSELLRRLDGLRPGYEGYQDQDLSLRAAEQICQSEIFHIPRILYHWRVHGGSTSGSIQSKPYVIEATRKSNQDMIKRRGLPADLVRSGARDFFSIKLRDDKKASWAILLWEEGKGFEKRHALSASDQLFANRAKIYFSGDFKASEFFATDKQMRPEGSSSGHFMNEFLHDAVLNIKEDIILAMNGSLVPVLMCDPAQLLIQAQREDIAAAGSLIWHNDRLLNGGFYPDVTGRLFPLLRGITPSYVSAYCWGQFAMPHPAIAPSPLCFAMRRENLLELAQLSEYGPLALSEYCLRAAKKGKKTLISPWGNWELIGPCREEPIPKDLKDAFQEKWGETIRTSGLRNPNLRAAPDDDWTLVFPD